VRGIYAFLDCGIPESGVARAFCDGCGHDYFVAFSCRMHEGGLPELLHEAIDPVRRLSGQVWTLDSLLQALLSGTEGRVPNPSYLLVLLDLFCGC